MQMRHETPKEDNKSLSLPKERLQDKLVTLATRVKTCRNEVVVSLIELEEAVDSRDGGDFNAAEDVREGMRQVH